jgi:carbon-monoxide dehydrogenase iron sulfur subunit
MQQTTSRRLRKVYAIEELCMGCGLCEVYCLTQHSRSRDILKAYKRERPKPLSRVRREVAHPLSFALQCRHCAEAPCVDACLTGAMHIDEKTGAVIHDPDRCMGCWTCIMVCPTGALNMDLENRIVAKCDLCGLSGEPACVANCPNGALEYREDPPWKP